MKFRIALVALPVAALALSGCGSNNFRDIEGVPSQRPDEIKVFNNVDGHPNVVKL
jgi:hypothetical protein